MERLATSWELSTVMVLVVVVAVICHRGVVVEGATASWCVARSNVKWETLQMALDYACGAGADCAPIQPNGLCYLPNTLMSHSSYAFNSFYQRKSKAPGSCDFSGAAYIAMTDPSYGSCVYPSSPSNAGGGPAAPAMPGSTTPLLNNPNSPDMGGIGGGGGSGEGLTPGVGDETPPSNNSTTSSSRLPLVLNFLLLSFSLIVLIFCDNFRSSIALVQ